MRAPIYFGKENIQIKDWPALEPGEGEVVVRVRYTGICGTDMGVYGGMHSRPMPPRVPGHEIFGHNETVGSNTDCSLHAGARVVIYPLILCGRCGACLEGDTHVCERLGLIGIDCDGSFAEFAKVKPHQLVAVPNEICDEEAALVSRAPLLCMP